MHKINPKVLCPNFGVHFISQRECFFMKYKRIYVFYAIAGVRCGLMAKNNFALLLFYPIVHCT